MYFSAFRKRTLKPFTAAETKGIKSRMPVGFCHLGESRKVGLFTMIYQPCHLHLPAWMRKKTSVHFHLSHLVCSFERLLDRKSFDNRIITHKFKGINFGCAWTSDSDLLHPPIIWITCQNKKGFPCGR